MLTVWHETISLQPITSLPLELISIPITKIYFVNDLTVYDDLCGMISIARTTMKPAASEDRHRLNLFNPFLFCPLQTTFMLFACVVTESTHSDIRPNHVIF